MDRIYFNETDNKTSMRLTVEFKNEMKCLGCIQNSPMGDLLLCLWKKENKNISQQNVTLTVCLHEQIQSVLAREKNNKNQDT